MKSNFSNVVDIIRYRALHQSHQKAFVFLEDGESESSSLTYQQLDQQARAIASRLQSLGLSGERALLLYPPGLDFITGFFGCLYAGVIAIPAYPPRRNHHMSRLESIITDAQATVILSTAYIYEQWFANFSQKTVLHWLTSDNISSDFAENWHEPTLTSDTLAFLQYTSGSTGKPKGVMVSHDNILCNSTDLDLGWEHTSDSVIVTWLPTFHDMGLIYGVIQPVYKGIPCYMMAPMSFLQRPIHWLKAISRYQATHSGAPNFAYELCVNKITSEQIATLNLSSWRMALNGAEPVRADVLKRFAQTFKPSGFELAAFCPGYGLAEATLKVSAVRQKDLPTFYEVEAELLEQNRVVEATNQENVRTLVGCGYSEIDTKIAIVNPQSMTICASDEVGEIWVSGSTVPQGYWRRDEETKQVFQAYISDTGEGPFLRTGDLGFLRAGELFVTGRIKDLVIIRGRNYYPQDIEQTAQQSHSSLKLDSNAAFTIEINNQEQLVIACEVERTELRKLNVNEVVQAICKAVSEQHELQVYAVALLKPGQIPKTSSGKIQRQTCRTKFLENSLSLVDAQKTVIVAENWIEQTQYKSQKPLVAEKALTSNHQTIQNWIVNWLSKKLKIEAKSIDLNKAFADFNLDSMLAVELAQDLTDWLNHPLDATILWNFPSIESLVNHLFSELNTSRSTHQTDAKQPLSSIQHKLSQNGRVQTQVIQVPTALEVFSDDEIAELLAEEISKSAQRK